MNATRPSYQIHLGDCLEVLRTMPDNSVDSIVTDPPYGLTANKKGGTGVASVNLKTPYGRARIGTGNGPGGFMAFSGVKVSIGLPRHPITEGWTLSRSEQNTMNEQQDSAPPKTVKVSPEKTKRLLRQGKDELLRSEEALRRSVEITPEDLRFRVR